MNRISINGDLVGGRSITILNGKIFVDGKDVTPDAKEIKIEINGNMDRLQIDHCQEVRVTGNIGALTTGSGDVYIEGNVTGSVQTASGDVECGSVGGSVQTASGDVDAEAVSGTVTTVSGDISHRR